MTRNREPGFFLKLWAGFGVLWILLHLANFALSHFENTPFEPPEPNWDAAPTEGLKIIRGVSYYGGAFGGLLILGFRWLWSKVPEEVDE